MSDVVVVGGGAAGLMAAIFAGRGGASVTLLEGGKACGLKILISGGGRCNILPAASDVDDFFTTGSQNVLRRLFRTWKLEDIYAFLEEELRIPLFQEEDSDKVFPVSQSARAVRDRLVEAAHEAGASIRVAHRVSGISRRNEEGFVVRGQCQGDAFACEAKTVIVATGGLSLPKTGSDGGGYELAKSLGHSLTALHPALVPLTSPDTELTSLSGVSVPVRWQAIVGKKVREERTRELLLTHKGFSGPAILDASHWVVREQAKLRVAWGSLDEEGWKRHFEAESRRRIDHLISDFVPRRLTELLLERAGLEGKTRGFQIHPKVMRRLLDALAASDLPVDGDEGYRKAEVTSGGIPLGEVNPSTLESRKAAGFFVTGEIFDVMGRMGGFNFLWAWITGRLAGESAASRAKSGATT